MGLFDFLKPKKELESIQTIESPMQKEVHDVKNDLQRRLLNTQIRLDTESKETTTELRAISKEIRSVALEISQATGRNRKDK